MVSDISWKPLILAIGFASKLKLLSAEWDSTLYCLKSIRSPKLEIPYFKIQLFRVSSVIELTYVGVQAINLLYLILFLMFEDQSSIFDKCFCSILLSCMLITASVQIHFFLHFEEVVSCTNAFLILEKTMRE